MSCSNDTRLSLPSVTARLDSVRIWRPLNHSSLSSPTHCGAAINARTVTPCIDAPRLSRVTAVRCSVILQKLISGPLSHRRQLPRALSPCVAVISTSTAVVFDCRGKVSKTLFTQTSSHGMIHTPQHIDGLEYSQGQCVRVLV